MSQDLSKNSYNVNSESKCPFSGSVLRKSAGGGPSNRDWWPNQLKLNILRQHSTLSNPMDPDFNYAEEFKSLDLAAVKADWAPISHAGQLHDRASYRFFWQVLQRAFDTGRVLPAEVREFFR